MKILTMTALVAVQLSTAVPAQAAELAAREVSTRPSTALPSAPLTVEDASKPGDARTSAIRVGSAQEPQQAPSAEQDEPKKRRSTGDKMLTGAAVILGVGALAMGGLMIAIFAN